MTIYPENSSRDHCHTLQTSKLTTTSDSTRKTCERRLKTEPKPHHQKEEPTCYYCGLPSPLGRPLGPWGWPIALCLYVLLPKIYTIDSKIVLGRFIQRWSGEMTRIYDVAILAPTPPRVLAPYPTSIPWPLLYLWPIYSIPYPPPS